VTFAGRFFGVFLTGAGNAAAAGVLTASADAPGVAELDAGLETPTIAGFGPCFEHALTTSNSPTIAKPAVVAIASFCWRDQDESIVPEIVLLVAWLLGFLSLDFQVVVILSPPLRLAQSEVIWQESGQPDDC
jgi:hypothetical protein